MCIDISYCVLFLCLSFLCFFIFFFFFQAEDGIRDVAVTGVQTCALPISSPFGRVRGNRHVENRDLAGLPGSVRGAVRSVLQRAESPPDTYCGSKCSRIGPLPPNGLLANRTHKWSRPGPPPPPARRRPQRTTL